MTSSRGLFFASKCPNTDHVHAKLAKFINSVWCYGSKRRPFSIQMKTAFFFLKNEDSSDFTKSNFLKTATNLVYCLANRWGYVYT